MYTKSKNSVAFLESLPYAGVGTLSVFSPELFPRQTLKAKSGSMARVRCYSGYIEQKSGKVVAFTMMFNHFEGASSKLTRKIEELLFSLTLPQTK